MKKFRIILDLVMVLLLPLLMGYSLVGELYHEIIGISMAVLFAAHITLNRKWFAHIFKGRYNARRVVTTAVNVLLILCVLTSMVSGIFISKHIFRFLGISVGTSLLRTLHMLAAYWGFVLMSFHAGTHGGMTLAKIKNTNHNCSKQIAFIRRLYYDEKGTTALKTIKNSRQIKKG